MGSTRRGTATLTNCTITGNSATASGAAAVQRSCRDDDADRHDRRRQHRGLIGASDIGGTVARRHRLDNLIGTGGSGGLINGSDGNIVLTSLAGLGLAPLGDYGGPTQTMALLPGSPAIGKGIAVAGITTDQRGFALDSPDPTSAPSRASPGVVVNTTGDGGWLAARRPEPPPGRQPGQCPDGRPRRSPSTRPSSPRPRRSP